MNDVRRGPVGKRHAKSEALEILRFYSADDASPVVDQDTERLPSRHKMRSPDRNFGKWLGEPSIWRGTTWRGTTPRARSSPALCLGVQPDRCKLGDQIVIHHCGVRPPARLGHEREGDSPPQ